LNKTLFLTKKYLNKKYVENSTSQLLKPPK
jgi:hypothetical protein